MPIQQNCAMPFFELSSGYSLKSVLNSDDRSTQAASAMID